MSAGSVRGVKIGGVPFNAAAGANISLNPRFEKEAIPHSGGNMIKRTIAAGNAEAINLVITPSEYEILRGLSDASGSQPLSYIMADGSLFTTQGEANLGPYQTDESSCEIMFLTSTGLWDIIAAS